MELQDVRDVSTARAWVATLVAVVAALALGTLLAPELVWDRFLWHYFWGPVYADAHNAACAIMQPGGPELVYSQAACQSADAGDNVVAEPGYTVVSEIGYAVTLVFFLVGVLALLRRLDVGNTKRLFFALFPFMFFGGALRVVEDANDYVPQGTDPLISYPWNTLFISPVIYFTVFAIVLGALVATVYADREGLVESYERPLFAFGWLMTLVTVGYLYYFVTSQLVAFGGPVGFYPQMTVLTIGLALAFAALIYEGAERYAPAINAGTGFIGFVVLFGHAVDGVANVLAADWLDALGIPAEYGAKHPVNRFLIEFTESIQPAWLSNAIGDSWTFLLVKLVAATLVVYVFDEQIFEESPRYSILLLIAILAVGLGPGSRDMLRATFGI